MKLLSLFSGCVLFLFQFSFAQQATQEEVLSFDSSKGILISLKEVAEIKELAKKGIEPHTSNVQLFLEFINDLIDSSQTWEKLEGEVVIFDRSASDPLQLSSLGGKLAYGTALAWHLTGDEKYAELCRQQILNLSKTYGFRNAEEKKFNWGAQGILNLARGGTPYIYAAVLLEEWEGWSANDKLIYQFWLRDEMYPKVAWASRVRKNNWGVAGSFSAALIAWYLADHKDWKLQEISPKKIKLSPQEAFLAHNNCQIKRLSTAREDKMDAKATLWGILPNGAIPEEIRRGDDPIDGTHLPSSGSGTKYTMTSIEHLTAHAEFLHQLGDNTLYDHVANDGSGSLLQAYLFVIDNPIKSHCFSRNRMNALYMAYHYYRHPAMLKSIQECGPGSISGQRLALYGRLTHPVKLSENSK